MRGWKFDSEGDKRQIMSVFAELFSIRFCSVYHVLRGSFGYSSFVFWIGKEYVMDFELVVDDGYLFINLSEQRSILI